MKVIDIYRRAVKKGIKEDPRSPGEINEFLGKYRKEYRLSRGMFKDCFDNESLLNPYADTRILFGNGSEIVRTVMVGIDIDVPELLLADRLREKGTRIDLVISHHPSGKALARLDQVMPIQPGIWEDFGFRKEVAKGIMSKRINEVQRGLSGGNHSRAGDAARLLGIPFMCVHTPADNCVHSYLQSLFDKKAPVRLQNVIDLLMGIPEYKHAICATGIAPGILIGGAKDKAGKILVDMTGGAQGPDSIYSRLSQAGVGTIVGMHLKESGYKAASSEFINYVVAGHISSDNLGMNLLFDEIDGKRELQFIECSGFKRFKR
ncbi:MAG: NGG1p interacting factor NIF3 [Candidatus Omnitrophica bacterium]|nr:NGG1p interacting factor NIF3 [Candidatus Omnitrophota bacterium]